MGQSTAWDPVVSGKPDSFAAQIEKNTVAGVLIDLSHRRRGTEDRRDGHLQKLLLVNA
jgi:hypothetical protein